MVWSGAARSTPINDKTDRKKPSAWRKGNRKTRRSVNAVSIAQSERYCQVNEKLVDRPPRYWAPASREPAMLGIKNGRRPQLDNTIRRALQMVEEVNLDVRLVSYGAPTPALDRLAGDFA